MTHTFNTEHQSRIKDTVIELRVTNSGFVESVFLEKCEIENFNLDQNFTEEKDLIFSRNVSQKSNYVRTTVGRILMHFLIINSYYEILMFDLLIIFVLFITISIIV